MTADAEHPDGGPHRRGRPVATSHDEIESVAFQLFADRGFAETTVEAIAAEVGIGRRTLFRYYESKNDIPWGRFAESLDAFRAILADMPVTMPLHETVHRAVVRFNDFDEAIHPRHRQRMRLILRTPALQAHSVLQYAEWRRVIAEHVSRRLGVDTDSLVPIMVGQVSLALALSAYEVWLDHPEASLVELLDEAMAGLRDYLR